MLRDAHMSGSDRVYSPESKQKESRMIFRHYKSKYLQKSEREREKYILKLLNYRYTYVDGTNYLPLRRKCVLALEDGGDRASQLGGVVFEDVWGHPVWY